MTLNIDLLVTGYASLGARCREWDHYRFDCDCEDPRAHRGRFELAEKLVFFEPCTGREATQRYSYYSTTWPVSKNMLQVGLGSCCCV
jgi:hypothetical protein